MKKIISVSIILILAQNFFIGCNGIIYEPKETYYDDIPETEYDIVTSVDSLSNFSAVYGCIKIKYHIDQSEFYFLGAHLYVGDNEYSTMDSTSITLYSSKLDDGIYNAVIEIWLLPKSNKNLAVKLGSEIAVNRYEWTMQIYNTIPGNSPSITAITKTPEGPKLEWEPYTYPNFNRLEVGYKDGSQYVKLASIADKTLSNYTDSTFTLGEREYYLKLVVCDNYIIPPSETRRFSHEEPGLIKLELLENYDMKITWHKPYFINNIKKIKIQQATKALYLPDTFDHGRFETLHLSSDLSDTTWIDENFGIGDYVYYRIVFEDFNREEKNTLNEKKIVLGTKVQRFTEINYSTPENTITLLHWNESMTKLDAVTFDTLEYQGEFYSIEPDQTHFYKISDGSLCRFETASGTLINIMAINEICNGELTEISSLVSRNNGRVFFSGKKGPTYIGNYIYDFNADSTIYNTIDGMIGIKSFSASPTGKYISSYDDGFYKIDKNGLTYIGALETYSFFYVDDETIMCFENGTVTKKRCSDLETLETLPYSIDVSNPTYDPVSNTIGGVTPESKFIVFEYGTGNIIHQINILDPDDPAYQFIWMNNTLFYRYGIYLKLNQ